jgi:hypothetical protein
MLLEDYRAAVRKHIDLVLVITLCRRCGGNESLLVQVLLSISIYKARHCWQCPC